MSRRHLRPVSAAALDEVRAIAGAAPRRDLLIEYLHRIQDAHGCLDADRLAVAAARRGVRVLPASQFYATAGPATHVRLAYSYASASEIAEGVRRLAQALEEAR